jgi:adenosylmethionine---8-amino-7-oxononanoate aminotransferase
VSIVDHWMKSDEAALLQAGLLRRLEPLNSGVGAESLIGNARLINFSSNDYLGLATHPKLVEAARACLAEFGVGTGASRLVVGDTVIHQQLEASLASLKKTESATLFNSGYAANSGALAAVCGEGDLILSDALNHASLVDGCRLSKADVRVYRHKDVEHAQWLLRHTRGHKRKLLVTDAVFSMDGDLAPLEALRQVCDENEAGLYVDEAHAVGVFGPAGAGLLAQMGVRADIVMGTLSKSFGAMGAYVAGPAALKNVLLSKARPLLFSTAFPAAIAAAAQAALRVVAAEPERQRSLWKNIQRLKAGLQKHDVHPESESAIFSIVLGASERSVQAAAHLREAGFLVKPIRPPTVPEGTSRLRIALSSGHTFAQIDQLVQTLSHVLKVTTSEQKNDNDKPSAKSTTSRLLRDDAAHVWHPFTQMQGWLSDEPLVIERAEGNWLFDTEGQAYFDGISSLWTTVHGHRHAAINRAIHRQVEQVAHTTLLGQASVPSIELAKALVRAAPPGLAKVFYSDSGSTAVEIAVKMAYQYWQLRARPLKTKFVALSEAYHGDTIGSVSVGGMDLFHERFRRLLFQVERVPTPHAYRWLGDNVLDESIAAVKTLLESSHEQLAALVIEPMVQGAAGMLMQPKGYLSAVAKLCRQHDVLLICDEVATGFGRTGKMFAVEHEGVAPDFLCVAKGLSGGYLPLAATLATDAVFDAFLGDFAELKTFFHGHTYTGNPVACAAAIANLEVFRGEATLQNVQTLSAYLSQKLEPLKAHPNVGDLRQCGLMIGIELVEDKGKKTPFSFERRIGFEVCRAAKQHGVLLRPLGNVVVLMPPLSMSRREADHLVAALERGIAAVLPS